MAEDAHSKQLDSSVTDYVFVEDSNREIDTPDERKPVSSIRQKTKDQVEKPFEMKDRAPINQAPSIQLVKELAKYRSSKWRHVLPMGQKFIVYYTYGPDPKKYNIEAPEVGISVCGLYESMEDAQEASEKLLKDNPNLVFFAPLRVVNLTNSKVLQIDYPLDGSHKDCFLEKNHQQIIENGLRNALESTERILSRQKYAKELQNASNAVNIQFQKRNKHEENVFLNEFRKSSEEAIQQAKTLFYQNFPEISSKEFSSGFEENVTTGTYKIWSDNPNDKNARETMENEETISLENFLKHSLEPNSKIVIRSCNYAQIRHYILLDHLSFLLPSDYRIVYKWCSFQDAEKENRYLVRLLQRKRTTCLKTEKKIK